MSTNPAMMLTISTHHGRLVGAPCRITRPLAYNYIKTIRQAKITGRNIAR